jgi:hypothetical protein
VLKFQDGKEEYCNSCTASYKLKVISFAEQFRNHAAQREFGIQRVLLEEKKKRIIKKCKK